jgi:acetoacetyl-CoA reductase
MQDLLGRTAIVTGGTRGIGAAITEMLACSGAHVAAGYSQSRARAEQLRDTLTERGCSVSIHQGNVGNHTDCLRVAEEVIADRGRIDFLVNNAGVTVDKTVRKMSVDDWHAVLRTNLSGSFYMTKAVLEQMCEQGYGRIVNISSVVGETGNIGQANYAASKSGLIGFSKSLALELARKGVTVNCVAPGFIDTEMVASVPTAMLETVIESVPVRRLGRPEEVAHAVCFLLDERSSYITGSVLAVNGGLEM